MLRFKKSYAGKSTVLPIYFFLKIANVPTEREIKDIGIFCH